VNCRSARQIERAYEATDPVRDRPARPNPAGYLPVAAGSKDVATASM
jgi:hypothetical protein